MVNNNKSVGLQFTPAERAILTTILYSDIFSFPLTKDELWKFLICEDKISRSAFESGLTALNEQIIFQDGYYCLQKRQQIISHRKKNLSEVVKKIKLAKKAAKKLSVIPSIVFIGISGGLAAGSATAKDDIDFVVIVKRNTLFVSRFLIVIILEILGIRRYRGQKETADTICINLMFDETALTWFGEKKDIYTAREIAQIFPLFERDGMYGKFMRKNSWITQFLPNISVSFNNNYLDTNVGAGFIKKIDINSFSELIFRSLQMNWMKRHQTREVVTEQVLALHPNDYRILTLKKLRLKMQQFGLLTNI